MIKPPRAALALIDVVPKLETATGILGFFGVKPRLSHDD